jgi:hypothetical protein
MRRRVVWMIGCHGGTRRDGVLTDRRLDLFVVIDGLDIRSFTHYVFMMMLMV